MNNIPVTFTYLGKQYSGFLSEVSGAGSFGQTLWHLMVDNFYWGQLHFNDRGFVFHSQTDHKGMMYLSEEFGEVVKLWYE